LSHRRRRKPEMIDGRIGMIGICILASAAAAEWLEIHAFLGPFLFGIALAPSDEDTHDDAYESFRRFTQGIFVPIYFVSLGLTTDFVAHFSWPLVDVILFVATVTKIPAAYAGARLGGLDVATSWAVGCGMNARGATGIILAGVGRDYGVIDRPTYVALVVMAIVTSLAAGPSMQACLAGQRRLATERSAA
jgi:Kef-type K+ transport system membrane component KefB